jgi:actin-like ATPase involved in cell morphogenesis
MTTQPIGIDFGTTKTLVCRWDERSQHPVPIRLGRGKDLIPTTVHLDSQGNYLFGDDAEDNRATDGAGYVSRFKRDLQTNVPKHIHGRTITPVELTAKFLTHVRERVEEEALHGPVGHAVITVPALYGPAAKANLKEAVKQAGFTDFDLLDEPVAAGFAFLHDNPDFAKGQTFLVFDWGGGTLDIAGVRHNGKELSSISQLIGGDAMLGGEDIDDDIGAGISEQLKQQGRKGIEEQPDEIRFSAWKSITDGKILLSRKVSHRFRLQFSEGPCEFEWKRDEFEQFISRTVEKAISLTKRLVEKAQEHSIPLAGVLLIGGSSDMPIVSRRVEEETGMKTLKYDKRQEAVAMGAAIVAYAKVRSITSRTDPIGETHEGGTIERAKISDAGSVTEEALASLLTSRYERLLAFFRSVGVVDIEAFVKRTAAASTPACRAAVVIGTKIAMARSEHRAEFELYLNEFVETVNSIKADKSGGIEDCYGNTVSGFQYLRDALREAYPDRAVANTSNLPQPVPRPNSDSGSITPDSIFEKIAKTVKEAGAVAASFYKEFFR